MDDAEVFLTDLANRMNGRIQLSTDGHRIYEGTVGPSFANDVDWAQIQKHYAGGEPGKYSPPVASGRSGVFSSRASLTPIESQRATSSDRT